MDAFPAFFPLAGRTVVIAGSGDAADAKARLFESSPAAVVRLDGREALTPDAYRGAALAFIAGDPQFCEAACRAAKAAGALVNVVDRPQLSDFNTPAVIDRGAVVAAVGTAGAAPMLATLLRSDIEARLPEGVGRIAVLLRGLQDELRGAFPDLTRRRAFLRQAISGPAAEAALAGDAAGAERLLRAAIETAPREATGRIRIVPGQGPADLLTLRATRALAEADVLIADADVSADVLELARRDAQRLSPQAAPLDRMIELARAGQVVRVITAPLSPAVLQGLAAAGAAVEVLSAGRP